ncbi:MAG: hypothetical protein LBI40_01390 [Treponema sp.]|nr:hypothetical protein [Treponema sp.]
MFKMLFLGRVVRFYLESPQYRHTSIIAYSTVKKFLKLIPSASLLSVKAGVGRRI